LSRDDRTKSQNGTKLYLGQTLGISSKAPLIVEPKRGSGRRVGSWALAGPYPEFGDSRWLAISFAWPCADGHPILGRASAGRLSGDASQDYFADGMTDELITDLAQIRALRVISPP
jgi:hypothetical protein